MRSTIAEDVQGEARNRRFSRGAPDPARRGRPGPPWLGPRVFSPRGGRASAVRGRAPSRRNHRLSRFPDAPSRSRASVLAPSQPPAITPPSPRRCRRPRVRRHGSRKARSSAHPASREWRAGRLKAPWKRRPRSVHKARRGAGGANRRRRIEAPRPTRRGPERANAPSTKQGTAARACCLECLELRSRPPADASRLHTRSK